MTPENTAKRIKHLTKILNQYRKEYFEDNSPSITDGEYDALYHELKDLEKQYPQFTLANTPTNQVGYAVVDGKIKHHQRLLSLGNVFSIDQFKEWMVPHQHQPISKYNIEWKLDGLALSLTYANRKLKCAATRGDGSIGEDVTSNVITLKLVPMELSNAYPEEEFEIQGEVLMWKDKFNLINVELSSLGKKPYSSPRNAAAGVLRTKEPKPVHLDSLTFVPYGSDDRLVQYAQLSTHTTLMELLSKSFDVSHLKLGSLGSDYRDYIPKYETAQVFRNGLAVDVDGLVIKVDSFEMRTLLGNANREPNWAIAWKFPAEEALATLTNVIWTMGRTGNLTPCAIFTPVTILGATITTCSLYNVDEIVRLGLKIGDVVTVARRGDVIPKIVGSDHSGKTDIQIPTSCPYCWGDLIPARKNIPTPTCLNPDCVDRTAAEIEYICSRECLNIDGLGPSNARHLARYQRKKVLPLAFLEANLSDLNALQITGRNAEKLAHEIAKARTMPLDKFIMSLCIDGIGKEMSTRIANHYQTLDQLVLEIRGNGIFDGIKAISGIGPITVRSWSAFMGDNRYWLSGLFPTNVLTVTDMPKVDTILESETFVITGSFSQSRDIIAKLLKSKGATVTAAVSKNTTKLLCGENPGSSLSKAQKLNIPVVGQEYINQLLME